VIAILLILGIKIGISAPLLVAQERTPPPLVTVRLSPGFGIPLGDNAEYLTITGGGGASALVSLWFFDIGLNGGYDYIAIDPDNSERSLSSIYGGLRAGASFNPVGGLRLSVFGDGGYFYGFFNDDPSNENLSGGALYVGGGGGIAYRFAPAFSLGAEVAYRNYIGLYQNLNVSLNAMVHIGKSPVGPHTREASEEIRPQLLENQPAEQPSGQPAQPEQPEPPAAAPSLLVMDGEAVELVDLTFDTIFPVFFKYYDENPVGRAIIRNTTGKDISDLKVSFFIKKYMDNPKSVGVNTNIGPGAEAEIPIYGLLNDEVLNITEGTKASARLELSYTVAGSSFSQEFIDTVRIHDRNAITWDDDRKAAAFVTAKDTSVQRLAKSVAGITSRNKALNAKLLMGIGLHAAIAETSLAYVIDPTTPYAELSKDAMAVDYMQFPSQTLEFNAGDCDDLTVLYASLFEAVGIETAFITIPGHIFMAFSLGITPDEARDLFQRPDELIFHDGKAWLPMEVTSIHDGFIRAWELGSKQWREYSTKRNAGLYPVHDAWRTYEPVGFSSGYTLAMPDMDAVQRRYLAELDTYVNREIYGEVMTLRGYIAQNPDNPKYRNKLGILYARYGMYDRAREEFSTILEKESYVPALLNMGNLEFLDNDYPGALRYFDRAAELSPEHPLVLLSIAKTNHELENYGSTKAAFDKLRTVRPALAERFAYLEFRGTDTARAADIEALRSEIMWEEMEGE